MWYRSYISLEALYPHTSCTCTGTAKCMINFFLLEILPRTHTQGVKWSVYKSLVVIVYCQFALAIWAIQAQRTDLSELSKKWPLCFKSFGTGRECHVFLPMPVNHTYLLVRVLLAHVHFSSRTMHVHVGNALRVSSFNIMALSGAILLMESNDYVITITVVKFKVRNSFFFCRDLCFKLSFAIFNNNVSTTVIVL